MKKINIYIGVGIAVSFIFGITIAFILTHSLMVVYTGIVFSAINFSWLVIYILLVKRKLSEFTSDICKTLDNMVKSNEIPERNNEAETLFVKINNRLIRLYEIMQESRLRISDDKAELESLLTDISHQVKTPISNLKMITSTISNETMTADRRNNFLKTMAEQIDKLDFLIQAMIKTSRLETGMIELRKTLSSIYETLAVTLGNVIINAEKKNIDIIVSCPEELKVPHDIKWTSEALFNIVDNAVKYTKEGGNIDINVSPFEMYTRIDITDNGKGIAENRHTDVFKRFYREEEVHDTEGIGIGLYLSREIIMKQGGYISLISTPDIGSTFSVYLQN